MSIYISVLLFIICIFLILITVIFAKDLRKITNILGSIRLRDYNRRIRPGLYAKVFNKLCNEINAIMDQFEDTIYSKQELEQAHKMFISEISHDIRTPMTTLAGYIEMLNIDNTLTDIDRKEYLKIAYDKSKMLCSLIEEFFELSKLDSENNILINERVDICEKARESLILFYNELENANIKPEFISPHMHVYVNGNSMCIERILVNLISNAIRYGKEGGVLGIEIRDAIDTVWVDVWDKGGGIQSEDIKFVFERMFTTDKSRNGRLSGSGLGLAITKKLVEKMNGEIHVYSTPNVKTVFSFYLHKHF